MPSLHRRRIAALVVRRGHSLYAIYIPPGGLADFQKNVLSARAE